MLPFFSFLRLSFLAYKTIHKTLIHQNETILYNKLIISLILKNILIYPGLYPPMKQYSGKAFQDFTIRLIIFSSDRVEKSDIFFLKIFCFFCSQVHHIGRCCILDKDLTNLHHIFQLEKPISPVCQELLTDQLLSDNHLVAIHGPDRQPVACNCSYKHSRSLFAQWLQKPLWGYPFHSFLCK